MLTRHIALTDGPPVASVAFVPLKGKNGQGLVHVGFAADIVKGSMVAEAAAAARPGRRRRRWPQDSMALRPFLVLQFVWTIGVARGRLLLIELKMQPPEPPVTEFDPCWLKVGIPVPECCEKDPDFPGCQGVTTIEPPEPPVTPDPCPLEPVIPPTPECCEKDPDFPGCPGVTTMEPPDPCVPGEVMQSEECCMKQYFEEGNDEPPGCPPRPPYCKTVGPGAMQPADAPALPGCPGGPPVGLGTPEECAEEDPPPWIICPEVEPPFENGKGPIPFEGMPKPASGEETSSGSVEVEYDPTPPEGEGDGDIQTLGTFEDIDEYTYSDELRPMDEPMVDVDKGKRGGKLARRKSAPYRAMTGWCSFNFI